MKIHKTEDQKSIKVVQFLEAYEKQENLWNPAVESYKNKAARDTSYMNIIEELRKPNLTINDIKLKIKSIRTTYTKELRLVTKHKEQGKPYIPKLFWFNRANSFLKDVSLSRDKRISFSERFKNTESDDLRNNVMDYMTDDPVDELSHVDPDPCHSDSNTFEYKNMTSDNVTQHMHSDIQMNEVQRAEVSLETKSNMISQQADFVIASINGNVISNNNNCAKYANATETRFSNVDTTNYLTTNNNNNDTTNNHTNNQNGTQTAPMDDEFDLFCRSVAAQLRSIPDIYSRSVAKLKIQQILFEAETGHYRNTSVTIPTDSQQLNAI